MRVRLQLAAFVLVVCPAVAAQTPPTGPVVDIGRSAIVVGTRTLTGPHSAPQVQGTRILLPVAAIGRALGDTVRIDAAARRVEVRRATGVTADFGSPTGQVRENGAPVFEMPDAGDVLFEPEGDDVLLPIEVVAALLDVSIVRDAAARAIRVSRIGAAAPAVTAGDKLGPLDLVEADYGYALDAEPGSVTQATTLHARGPLGPGTFMVDASLAGGTGEGLLGYRFGSFQYLGPNGLRLIAGDFGTGTELSFQATAIRGLLFSHPIDGVQVTGFAGRSVGTARGNRTGAAAGPPGYDTTVAGVYAAWSPKDATGAPDVRVRAAAGASAFTSPDRHGAIVSASLSAATDRNRFDGEVGVGSFGGDGATGVAALVDVSDSFSVTDALVVQARFAHIGSNFRSPSGDGLFRPSTSVSAGASYRATSWLGTSVFVDVEHLLDGSDITRRSVTATARLDAGAVLPSIYATFTRTADGKTGARSFALVSAVKDFERWRLFGSLARTEAGIGATTTGTAGAVVALSPSSSIVFKQTIATGGTFGDALDWSAAAFGGRMGYSAGFEYTRGAGRATFAPRLRISTPIPGGHELRFSIVRTPLGQQYVLSLAGPLLPGRGTDFAAGGAVAVPLGSISGRVFDDANLSGFFEAEADRPLGNVRVLVDGIVGGTTASDGTFAVAAVTPGLHTVSLDLMTVRADLTLLSEADLHIEVAPRRNTALVYRLVRTGRIAGTVWLDANGDGRIDDGETRLGGVRVVALGGRDTLTDAYGVFVIGDLPPGEQPIVLDAKTLPEGVRAVRGSQNVTVRAAAEVPGVDFPVAPIPREVEVKRFPR